MIASFNIVAKTLVKIAKTFVGLSATIVAKGRRFVLILHLEAKYAKTDCKNEIYANECSTSKSIVQEYLLYK